MTAFEILHKLILGPIELLLDVIFCASMQITQSPALSIFVLSLAVSLLVLPLYKRADALQRKENETAARIRPDVDHIKKTFSGDQRFMTLQSYYRKQNYKPYYVLRGSMSLLLQVPFFMAAYNFLSNLAVLRGVSFGPIADLAAPDGMLTVAGITVNVLPILMTVVNLISGMLYSRDMPLKSKIQMYGVTLIFLVLLYRSPAGLVLYWTLNNVFSLCKNILYKLLRPKRILRIASMAAGFVLGIFFIVRFKQYGAKKAAFGIGAAIVLQIPMAVYWIKRKFATATANKTAREPGSAKDQRMLFYTCCILLSVLTGLLIPSAIIHASPAEFVEVGAFRSPLDFVLHAFLLAAGTFLIWCVIYYMLMDEKGKTRFSLAFAILSVAALVNYMFFGNAYGNMSSLLLYDTDPNFKIRMSQILLNAGVLLTLTIVIRILWKKRLTMLRVACVLICGVITCMSLVNIFSVNAQIPEIRRVADRQQAGNNKVICLNRKGKNVIVLMLDRAIGYYAPFIFEEKPELREQFAGFVCYLNTLSYGFKTNVGSPALFGGYEYVPKEMDQRSNVLLKDKQNEALKVMPLIFRDNGYEVTVCDPKYANYSWIPDLSIYDDYPDIRTNVTEGRFGNNEDENAEDRDLLRERNLFCYSIFRISPIFAQSALYDGGNYNKTDANRADISNFDRSYLVLKNLPNITSVRDKEGNTFLMMSNNTTHEVTILQEPQYEPAENVDNTEYDREHPFRVSAEGEEISLSNTTQLEHYQSNMAALLQIGKWLDYLRKQDVYDNTRIILVADHGHNLDYPEMKAAEVDVDIGGFNPLLLVKDFDASEAFGFSKEFMTNADTPVIAFAELVENPVNPFTGKRITNQDKQNNEQIVCISPWDTQVNNGYVFSDSHYYAVKNHEVLNPENWSEAQ